MLATREEDFFIVQDALVQHIGAARALRWAPPFAWTAWHQAGCSRNTDGIHSLQFIFVHVCVHRHV